MKALKVFEKFEDDSDPIQDMGIGQWMTAEDYEREKPVRAESSLPYFSNPDLDKELSPNRATLKKIFGSYTFRWPCSNYLGYIDVWCFKLKDGVLLIFSTDKGVDSYEYFTTDGPYVLWA